MPEYKIKIFYQTGSSVSSEDETTYLELTWKNLTIAKENLQRINDHYEMHQAINSYSYKLTRDQLFLKNKDAVWFVNKPKLYCISSGNAIDEKDKPKVGVGNWTYRPDEYYAEHCLLLKTDDGKTMQLSAFWCGHFERLYSIEIEINNDGLKFTY